MLNVAALLLSADSPQAALIVFGELTAQPASQVPAAIWRECARRLTLARASVPAALAGRYETAIARCLASAVDQRLIIGEEECLGLSERALRCKPLRSHTVTVPIIWSTDDQLAIARGAVRS